MDASKTPEQPTVGDFYYEIYLLRNTLTKNSVVAFHFVECWLCVWGGRLKSVCVYIYLFH